MSQCLLPQPLFVREMNEILSLCAVLSCGRATTRAAAFLWGNGILLERSLAVPVQLCALLQPSVLMWLSWIPGLD